MPPQPVRALRSATNAPLRPGEGATFIVEKLRCERERNNGPSYAEVYRSAVFAAMPALSRTAATSKQSAVQVSRNSAWATSASYWRPTLRGSLPFATGWMSLPKARSKLHAGGIGNIVWRHHHVSSPIESTDIFLPVVRNISRSLCGPLTILLALASGGCGQN